MSYNQKIYILQLETVSFKKVFYYWLNHQEIIKDLEIFICFYSALDEENVI